MIKVEPCYYSTQSFHYTVRGIKIFFVRYELEISYNQDDISIYSNWPVEKTFNLAPWQQKHLLFNDTLKIIHPSINKIRSIENTSYSGDQIMVRIEKEQYGPKLVGFVASVTEEDYKIMMMKDICD